MLGIIGESLRSTTRQLAFWFRGAWLVPLALASTAAIAVEHLNDQANTMPLYWLIVIGLIVSLLAAGVGLSVRDREWKKKDLWEVPIGLTLLVWLCWPTSGWALALGGSGAIVLFPSVLFAWKQLRLITLRRNVSGRSAELRAVLFTWLIMALSGSLLLLLFYGQSVYLWFAIGAHSFAGTYLAGPVFKGRRTWLRRLASIGLKSMAELSLCFTAVAGSCAVLSLYASRLRPDSTKLDTLQHWEAHAAILRKVLGVLKLSSPQTLAVLGILFGLKLIIDVTSGERSASLVTRVWSWIKVARLWIGRAYVLIVIATSFTFLGEQSDGPISQFEAAMKNARKTYGAFRRDVRKKLESELAHGLLDTAWNQAPVATRDAINRSYRLSAKRLALDKYCAVAYRDHEVDLAGESLRSSSDQSQKFRAAIDDAIEPEENVSSVPPHPELVTIGSLRGASEDGETLAESTDANIPLVFRGMGDELAKKLVRIPVSAWRFGAVKRAIEALSAEYPVAGEFIETVFGAIDDFVIEKLETGTQRICRGRLERRGFRLDAEVQRVVAEITPRVQFAGDMSSFSTGLSELEAEEKRIAETRSNVAKSVAAEELRTVNELKKLPLESPRASNSLREVESLLQEPGLGDSTDRLIEVTSKAEKLIRTVVQSTAPEVHTQLKKVIGERLYDTYTPHENVRPIQGPRPEIKLEPRL